MIIWWFLSVYSINIPDFYSLKLPFPGSSNETHNIIYGEIQIFIYAYMLIYHRMPPLFVSLDQIQKIRKIVVFYFVIYVFIEKEKLYGIKYTF